MKIGFYGVDYQGAYSPEGIAGKEFGVAANFNQIIEATNKFVKDLLQSGHEIELFCTVSSVADGEKNSFAQTINTSIPKNIYQPGSFETKILLNKSNQYKLLPKADFSFRGPNSNKSLKNETRQILEKCDYIFIGGVYGNVCVPANAGDLSHVVKPSKII